MKSIKIHRIYNGEIHNIKPLRDMKLFLMESLQNLLNGLHSTITPEVEQMIEK